MIRTHTLVGAAGAGALVVVAGIGPAVAAGEETADVKYTCVTSAGNATPTAHYAVNAPPAKMVAGQKVSLPTTATFTLDAFTTGLAVSGFGWVSFDGTIKTPPSGSTVGQNLSITKTTMGNGPSGSTVAPATGHTILRATKAGTYTLRLGNLGAVDPAKGNVTLNGYDGSGTLLNSLTFPDGNPPSAIDQCKNDAGKTTLKDSSNNPATVAVSKDASKTTVKAAYAKAKKQAVGTAKVRGKNFGLTGTGKVKLTLKKGVRTIKTIKGVKLNKRGVARAVFKGVTKRGKYTVIASYGGSAGLKASSGRGGFSVR